MEPSEVPTGRPSPRRELQGPRPTPLKIRKDSYKIRKPPPAPAPSQPPQPPPQHRPPVIIYTVSPKVIHTDVNEFMTLVQRLTGNSSSSSSSSSISSSAVSGALSPAARLATIERTTRSPEGERSKLGGDFDMVDQFDIDAVVDRAGQFPGILSPIPASLPPISPNLFSPFASADLNSFGFLHDLSPIFGGNRNFIEGTLVPSPNALFSAPIPSPSPSFDFFNPFFDL